MWISLPILKINPRKTAERQMKEMLELRRRVVKYRQLALVKLSTAALHEEAATYKC